MQIKDCKLELKPQNTYFNVVYFYRIFFIFIISSFAFTPIAFATEELKGERISIVYDNPELAGFAQEVAQEASKALELLTELLNFQPRHTTLVIDDTTDSYNAFAITNPHLKVSLRPLYPTESALGFRTKSELYSLMLHELTHTAQLTYTATESSDELVVANERFIFTAGDVASVPPAWFVEGIATWVESTYGGGGRLNDAFTTGIIQSLALEDAIPPIQDVSLTTFAQWPYGRARYLFGASFVDYLIKEYSFQTIIDMLHVYNQGGLIGGIFNDFSSAWFEVTGGNLSEEWSNWQKSQKSKALLRTFDKPKTLSEVMSSLPSARLSPDSKYIVWSGSQGIMKAELSRVSEDITDLEVDSKESEIKTIIELNNIEMLFAGVAPRKLDWYSSNKLVYSRTVRDNLTSFRKVFLLDVESGQERLFSSEQRLKRLTTNPKTKCVFAIRDIRPEPSLLVELCPVIDTETANDEVLEVNTIWQAPNAAHFLDIAINVEGEVLLSLWDAGKTDIGIFDTATGELELLMHDAGQDLEPAWRIKDSGASSIVFRSDRHLKGSTAVVFEVYELEPRRSTQQKGGAFQPISLDDDTLIYSALGDAGFQLASLDTTTPNLISYVESPEVSYQLETVSDFKASYDVVENETIEGFSLETYQPVLSMLPYAVSPVFSVSNVDLYNLVDVQYFVGATAFSEDITGKHSFSVSGGLNNILTGHLDGQYLLANYSQSITNTLIPVSQRPIELGLSVGVWPHFPFGEGAVETALGARAFLNLKLPNDDFVSYANLSAGLVNLQSRPDDWFLDGSVRLMISKQRRDTWDYVLDGYRSALLAAVSPSESGLAGGAWFTTMLVSLDYQILVFQALAKFTCKLATMPHNQFQ